jgi:DHA1 family bicyclomycin/chloramphenicol resistance-like MFS transporter
MAEKLRPDSLAFIALLAFLAAFGPLSVDLYLPSLPSVGPALGATEAQVQLTISLYLVGYAIGQVVYGPISDRFGRKPVLVSAFLIYCVASIACLVSQRIEWLVAARIAQALGASGAMIITRAIVRDLHEGVRAGQQLSLMGSMMAVMPLLAPLIGGVLWKVLGWRSGFAFQFAVGALAALLATRYLAESRAPTIAPLRVILANYRIVLSHPAFLANLVIGALAYAGLFAWIVGSPFVLQGLLKLTPVEFSLFYALANVGFMLGGAAATRVVTRWGLDRTAGAGALVLALAGAVMIASVAIDTALPVTLTLATALYLFGLGIALPQTIAAALTPFPQQAGTASSLIGFAQQCSGAIMGVIVGSTLSTTAWPMALGLAATSYAALLLWIVTRRVRVKR